MSTENQPKSKGKKVILVAVCLVLIASALIVFVVLATPRDLLQLCHRALPTPKRHPIICRCRLVEIARSS